MSEDSFVDWHISQLDYSFTAQVDPSHVAAIFVEPVQGEGGFVPAPFLWLRRLRELADQHGILFVSDEIQAGMGRTGRLWAIDHSGVVPDLLTTAKSLAAGMPLSAVVGRAEVMDAPHPEGLGGTYSGNPLACVAAIEAIDQISQPEFLARSKELGIKLRARLEAIQADHPSMIGDVRGLGIDAHYGVCEGSDDQRTMDGGHRRGHGRYGQTRRHNDEGGTLLQLRPVPTAARHFRCPAG